MTTHPIGGLREAALLVALVLAGLTTFGCKRASEATQDAAPPEGVAEPSAEEAPHRAFASPEAAVAALEAALEGNDTEELKALFGPGGESLVDWGDPAMERQDRTRLLALLREKRQLVDGEDGVKELEVGEAAWPLPAPIVERDGQWLFDGDEGTTEFIYRRIGRNELGAIEVARGFVDAQYEYASKRHDGNIRGLFAAYFISDPGQQNGLYWPSEEGKPESPAGPFVAAAAGEGYRRAASGAPTPYHGYYYRMLYAQGPDAGGGAKDYFVDGRLVDGFALVAWPAAYAESGVQTFVVNQDGVVYQKDLGEQTPSEVTEIRAFNPDATWTKVDSESP